MAAQPTTPTLPPGWTRERPPTRQAQRDHSKRPRKDDSGAKRHRRQQQPASLVHVDGAMLREDLILALTGWSASTLRRRIQAGQFAPPVYSGPRCKRWPAQDVRPYLPGAVIEEAA
jgi:predicted DNA-binding transcriptional regulator AlpA